MGEYQNSPYSFNVAPTKSENRPALRVIDFRLKHSCRQIGTKVIHDRTTVSLHTQSPASWGKNLIAFFRVSVKFIFFLSLSVNRKAIQLCTRLVRFIKAIIGTAKGRLRIDSSQFSGLSHSSNPEHQSGCSHIHFISLRDVEHLRKTFPHNSS